MLFFYFVTTYIFYAIAVSSMGEVVQDNKLPDIFTFVLTGGPCSGKTTALRLLQGYLQDHGFRVFMVPEAATLFFSHGMSIEDFGIPEVPLQFQISVLKTQMHLEDLFREYAKKIGEKSVILCDRGTKDGAAYISNSEWEHLLKVLQLNSTILRDHRYDAVFHLVTAADGAPIYYSLDNNIVRTESIEEAIQVDKNLQQAWKGHPHHYIIDNVGPSFDYKMDGLKSSIAERLGIPSRKSSQDIYFTINKIPDFSQVPTIIKLTTVQRICLLLLPHQEVRTVAPGDKTQTQTGPDTDTESPEQTLSSMLQAYLTLLSTTPLIEYINTLILPASSGRIGNSSDDVLVSNDSQSTMATATTILLIEKQFLLRGYNNSNLTTVDIAHTHNARGDFRCNVILIHKIDGLETKVSYPISDHLYSTLATMASTSEMTFCRQIQQKRYVFTWGEEMIQIIESWPYSALISDSSVVSSTWMLHHIDVKNRSNSRNNYSNGESHSNSKSSTGNTCAVTNTSIGNELDMNYVENENDNALDRILKLLKIEVTSTITDNPEFLLEMV